MSERDWVAWHEVYDRAESGLADRLEVVRRYVRTSLVSVGSPVRLLSLCAGDGRDVIPVLEQLGGTLESSATLVELSAPLVEQARAAAAAASVNVSVIEADAGAPDQYASALQADVVLLCGIFGNVSDVDVRKTVANAGALVRRGGFVVWTRHRRAPDLTPAIRAWFTADGFEEVGFHSPGPDCWSAGLHKNSSARARLIDHRLFTFLR